jgi:hypothetical protein
MEIRYAILDTNEYPSSEQSTFINDIRKFSKDIENEYNVTYRKTCLKCSHILIVLASTTLIKNHFKSKELFSWTDQKANVIFFSYENWKNLTLKKSSVLYRKYLVMHELLHAYPFYSGHTDKRCSKKGAYNVMYQQTRNTRVSPEPVCSVSSFEFPDINISIDFDKKESIKLKKSYIKKTI